MNKTEFDRFADEYQQLHSMNIKVSGEEPEFFAEYKVRDTAKLLRKSGMTGEVRILDFGSGVGNSIPHFKRHIPSCDLICLDVSQKSLSVAEKRFPTQAKMVSFDGRLIPFPNEHFDVIFSACVFHHIPCKEHPELLRELYRVLSRRGLVVIFEHNPLNLITIRTVNACPFDKKAILVPAKQLVRNMINIGFIIQFRHYRIFFPGPLRAFRVLRIFSYMVTPRGSILCCRAQILACSIFHQCVT